MQPVCVRFPPSPTGYLHIGGARTALFNWLFARKHGGKLILRIEDTDAQRSTQASIEGIIDGLQWLGLDWDEGPYFQTQFADEHAKAAKFLLESGQAYKCFCTKQTLDAKREKALAEKKPLGYDGTCRNLTEAEVREHERRGIPSVIRFKVPRKSGVVGFDDHVLGSIRRPLADVEDFVIVRSNGEPLYLLCNVVDDIRDHITHVIRGQDHMTNTTRQILLYEALGASTPIFAHMPLTLDRKKRKISKRHHGEVVSVQFYREKGILPWALCNFLVLLGWNPGDNQEIFSRESLIEAFSLERIGKVNSVFNYQAGDPKFFTDPKLMSINEHYLRSMDIEALGRLVKNELVAEGLWMDAYEKERKEWYLSTIAMIRARFHTLKDFTSTGRAYFGEDYVIEEKPKKKNLDKHPQLEQWLPELARRYSALSRFDETTTEKATREMASALSIKPGILINGLRTVLTGQLAGPGMFDILVTLGRKTVVKRLDEAGRFFA